MESLSALFSDPAAWAALAALITMEVVLGIDNLIFISILSNKLPEEQRQRARRLGIALALIMRLVLLSMIAWLVGLTATVVDLGLSGPPNRYGEPSFETVFSWRDLILIAGGLFLIWKATKEIHHNVDPTPSDDVLDKKKVASLNFGSAIFQIILLDMVFSIDSILTAVGHDRQSRRDGDRGARRRRDHAARRRAARQFHRPQPDGRDARPRLPPADRGRPHRRRLRSARAQGLYLCGHGLFGAGRAPQHALAPRPAAQGDETSRRRLKRGLATGTPLDH
jgi:hypothetical protein